MILCCRFTINKTVFEYINKNIADLLRNYLEVATDKLFSASIPSRNNASSTHIPISKILIYIYDFRINLSLTTLRDYTIADRNEHQ